MLESFESSREYRHGFVEESIASRLTAQIHAMRTEHGWTPQEFADKIGKKLSWVYRLEDPNSPPPTIPTLLGVAEALDIGLDVRFIRFSELLDDVAKLTPESFLVPSFDSELRAGAFKARRVSTRRPGRRGLFVMPKKLTPEVRRKRAVSTPHNYGGAMSDASSLRENNG